DHREPARDLLRLVVRVDGRLLDHLLEPRLADAGKSPVLPPHGSYVKSSSSSPTAGHPRRTRRRRRRAPDAGLDQNYHTPPIRARSIAHRTPREANGSSSAFAATSIGSPDLDS